MSSSGNPEGAEASALAQDEYNLSREEIEASMRASLDMLGMVAMPEDITLQFPEIFSQLWEMLKEALGKTRDFSKFAVGLPRGHGKTIVLKLLVLYIILFTNRRFVLIVCASAELAENIIADVVDMLDSDNIVQVFGNWRFNMEVDRQQFKKFRFRGRDIMIRGVGAETAIRGISVKNKRPDVIILDDAQTKECAESIPAATKFLSWFLGTLMKAKSPTGCTYIYVGNMYVDLEIKKGVFGCMLRNLSLNRNWISFVVGAILQDGKALWEELFPLEQLYQELDQDISMNSQDVFFAEVLNDPKATSGQHLDVTKIAPFNTELSEAVASFIVIDPMSGKKDPKLDALAIGYFEVHEGVPVLMRLSVEQFTPLEVIHHCLKWCEETGCRAIAAETVAYQSTLLFWFGIVCQQLGISGIELLEVHPRGRPKNSRILDFFKRWMREEVGVTEELYGQVVAQGVRFNPLVKKNVDDILDVMAYSEDVLLQYPESLYISTSYNIVSVEGYIEGSLISS